MDYGLFYDNNPGRTIFRLRKSKRMTQENLAGNVCSTASISRIENGSQIPTRRTFYRLMEQLGETGFSYGDYYDGFSLEEMYLKRDLLDELNSEKTRLNEDYLWEFMRAYKKNDVHERQFFEFVKTLYWEKMCAKEVDFPNKLLEVIKITHPSFDPINGVEGMFLNTIQMMIVNAYAVACMEEGRTEDAVKLFMALLGLSKRSRHILEFYYRVQATLYNNLAVCEMDLGFYKIALKHCKKAIGLCQKEGGIFFYLKILRTEMACHTLFGNTEGANEDKRMFYKIYSRLPEKTIKDCSPENFLRNRRSLLVF